MSHHCHARGCQVNVKPELLFCWNHWKQVPKNIRQAVYQHYRPGQCDDKHPSEAWHEAADAAIGYVAQKEGHQLRQIEVEALEKFGYTVKVPKVVNISSGEPYDILVDRTTKFGNPYSHIPGYGKWPVDTREEAIRLYEEWLRAQPELMAAVKKELKNKILACWCSPLPCHGSVLLKIANEEDDGEQSIN